MLLLSDISQWIIFFSGVVYILPQYGIGWLHPMRLISSLSFLWIYFWILLIICFPLWVWHPNLLRIFWCPFFGSPAFVCTVGFIVSLITLVWIKLHLLVPNYFDLVMCKINLLLGAFLVFPPIFAKAVQYQYVFKGVCHFHHFYTCKSTPHVIHSLVGANYLLEAIQSCRDWLIHNVWIPSRIFKGKYMNYIWSC